MNLRTATLPETNSEFTPENQWMEDEFPFGKPYFRGAFAVSFREGMFWTSTCIEDFLISSQDGILMNLSTFTSYQPMSW